MKVAELVNILNKCDQNQEVSIFWDGGARSNVEGIVNNKSDGLVIVADWSIYRKGNFRAYPENEIIWG